MVYRRKEPCGWDAKSQAPELEELHEILKCAAEQGCRQCVGCSEKAFNLLNERIKAISPGIPTILMPKI